jgi:DNA-binding FadR family transcriptional regulator
MLESIGTDIVHGRLTPGTVLTISDLMQQYEVSRSVALHALRGLEMMGLVYTRRRVGITIQDPSRWMVYDPRIMLWRMSGPGSARQLENFTELRTAFEPFAARLCAARANRQVSDTLIRLAAEMEQASFGQESPDYERIMSLDCEYHTLILTGTENYMFAALEGTTRAVIRGWMTHARLPEHPVREAVEAHRTLALAIRDRDGDAAERIMIYLMGEVANELSSTTVLATSALDGPFC